MDITGVGTLCLWLGAVVCLVQGQGYVNVAPGKTYSQSSFDNQDNPHPSSYAANGNTGGYYGGTNNCIHTAANGDLNPWWEVNLGRTYPVNNVTVWGRYDFADRMYPFNITVDGQLCASVPNTTQYTRQKTVTCPSIIYGQTVRFTRITEEIAGRDPDKVLNLCEMQIWVQECGDGHYRATNGMCVPCSVGCLTCDKEDGTCQECQSGFYNNNGACARCSDGCGAQGCDKATGRCHGCDDGRYGARCDMPCQPSQCLRCAQDGGACIECQSGYYNNNGACVACSDGCDAQGCDKATGRCHGCDDGRHGPRCDMPCQPSQCQRCAQDGGQCQQCTPNTNVMPPQCTECLDGFYNNNGACVACSDGCDAQGCDKATGRCYGCDDGRHGPRCDMSCQPSQCQQCAQDGGQCQQCKANTNVMPPQCTDCEAGRYGASCSGHCGHCVIAQDTGSCHVITGHCPRGCQDGWKQTPLCDEPCEDGWYGNNCSHQCGPCEGGAACNKTTGHCACAEGKQPPLCDQNCTDGTYGQDCGQSCGQCSGGQPCDPVTGHCPAGCQPGWTDQRPSDPTRLCQTAVAAKDDNDGTTAIIGAVVGTGLFLGICIVIAAVLCIWYRRRSSHHSRNAAAKSGPKLPPSAASSDPAAEDTGRHSAGVAGLVGEEEGVYERVDDKPEASGAVHAEPSSGDPGYYYYNTAPGSGSDNPYDHPAVGYSNTGDVHIYDPWRVSRAAQRPDSGSGSAEDRAERRGTTGQYANVVE